MKRAPQQCMGQKALMDTDAWEGCQKDVEWECFTPDCFSHGEPELFLQP